MSMLQRACRAWDSALADRFRHSDLGAARSSCTLLRGRLVSGDRFKRSGRRQRSAAVSSSRVAVELVAPGQHDLAREPGS